MEGVVAFKLQNNHQIPLFTKLGIFRCSSTSVLKQHQFDIITLKFA